MRGKLLLTVGVAVSVAVVAFGPRRGGAPAVFLEAAHGRSVLRAACARPSYPEPPSYDPRHFRPEAFRPVAPQRPLVRDLLLRYP